MCLHGVTDTWRTWELVLPALERRHDVLALTLPGHAGGPPLTGPVTDATMADAVERAMDEAGFATAHLVGNSLGGYVALQLAARGRARTVVALAPAGGWAPGDPAVAELFVRQREMHEALKAGAPHARGVPELLAHQMLGAASARVPALVEHAQRSDWPLDPERITCPVRVVWGADDALLSWPSAAVRYRHESLPHADWIVLDGVGHHPQLDAPLETAQLILGFTS